MILISSIFETGKPEIRNCRLSKYKNLNSTINSEEDCDENDERLEDDIDEEMSTYLENIWKSSNDFSVFVSFEYFETRKKYRIDNVERFKLLTIDFYVYSFPIGVVSWFFQPCPNIANWKDCSNFVEIVSTS